MHKNDESGFSLVELLIAMTVTLIITGAVYGLMSGGQNAFRREPEMVDRQQNIRLAMDLIMRDVATAGAAMPPFMQTFRVGLDGATLGGTPTAPSNAPTDELEIMANPNNFEPEESCNYPGGSNANVRLRAAQTRVQGTNMTILIMLTDGHWTIRNINGGVNFPPSGDGNCDAAQNHANVQFTNGGDSTGFNLAGGLCAGTWDGTQCGTAPGNACVMPDLVTARPGSQCTAAAVLLAEIVRYRIRNGADGVPNLERFSSALSSAFTGGAPQFEVVARGIDDLQVRYRRADGTETDNAQAVDQTQLNYNTVINRVTVTLSSRAEGQKVQGMTTAASGARAAIRGTLTSQGAPRAALVTLGIPVAQRKAGWSGPEWN